MDQQRDRDQAPSEFEEPERPRQDDVKNSADEFADEDEFDTHEEDDADTAE